MDSEPPHHTRWKYTRWNVDPHGSKNAWKGLTGLYHVHPGTTSPLMTVPHLLHWCRGPRRYGSLTSHLLHKPFHQTSRGGIYLESHPPQEVQYLPPKAIGFKHPMRYFMRYFYLPIEPNGPLPSHRSPPCAPPIGPLRSSKHPRTSSRRRMPCKASGLIDLRGETAEGNRMKLADHEHEEVNHEDYAKEHGWSCFKSACQKLM